MGIFAQPDVRPHLCRSLKSVCQNVSTHKLTKLQNLYDLCIYCGKNLTEPNQQKDRPQSQAYQNSLHL